MKKIEILSQYYGDFKNLFRVCMLWYYRVISSKMPPTGDLQSNRYTPSLIRLSVQCTFLNTKNIDMQAG